MRQGGDLSHLPFNFYTDSALGEITETNTGRCLDRVGCNVLAYADDVASLARKGEQEACCMVNGVISLTIIHFLSIENKRRCMTLVHGRMSRDIARS